LATFLISYVVMLFASTLS